MLLYELMINCFKGDIIHPEQLMIVVEETIIANDIKSLCKTVAMLITCYVLHCGHYVSTRISKCSFVC